MPRGSDETSQCLVNFAHTRSHVSQGERIFRARLFKHLSPCFLQGIDLRKGGSDDDGSPDSSTEQIDTFPEGTTDNQTEN